MAVRPIYISTNIPENPFIKKDIEFNWIKGMSYKQKCKRREEFHKAIANTKLYNIDKVLEISTKSDKELGVKLSALNLMVPIIDGKKMSVEDIYQKAKIYDDEHHIIEFKYLNTVFENEPYSMFYDYVYMLGLHANKELLTELNNYDIFTDIEFNPSKQLNTQARAAAIWNTLYRNNMIKILKDKEEFKRYYKSIFKK